MVDEKLYTLAKSAPHNVTLRLGGIGVLLRAVMLGYWVILVGIALDILGTIWDVIDDLTGEEALGGLLTPERLKFLGIVVAILGLVVGFRLGLRSRR